jgi:hypothetical protein
MNDVWRSALLLTAALCAACMNDGRVSLVGSSTKLQVDPLVDLELEAGHHLALQSLDSGHVMLVETLAPDQVGEADVVSLAFNPKRVPFTTLYRELLAQSDHVIAPVPGAMERLRALDRQFAEPEAAPPPAELAVERHYDYNISAEFADDFRLLAQSVCYASDPEADVCEVGRSGWDQLSTTVRSLSVAMYNESNDATDPAELFIFVDPCSTSLKPDECDVPAKQIQALKVPPRTIVLTSIWSAEGNYTLEATGAHWGWAAATR